MNELPEGWQVAPIRDVTVHCDQRAPTADEEFYYIDIASVDRITKSIVNPQKLTGRAAPSRARKAIRKGDVLVSMTRPNLNAVALVPDHLDGQIASTGFEVLRAPGLDPRWLFYLVRTESFVSRMSGLVQGALYPAVRPKDVQGFEAPLAPFNEQKRIVDKLDALLARADACRERLDRVPAILKRFRQSILAAATSGKLTEDWRAENPDEIDAQALAEEIQAAHKEAGGHKIGKAAVPTQGVHNLSAAMFPDGWALLTLRDLVRPDRPITYGILKPGPDIQVGVQYVRVADFPDERLDLTTIRKTSPKIDEEFRRSRLRRGDLLLSIRGTVGRVIVVPDGLDGANITQDSARLSIQPSVNRDYVLWCLRSELAQTRMKGAIKGVAVRGINIGDVRALQVPIPSPSEQDEIVRRVAFLMAHADRLEARYSSARAYVERLAPALLAKAFCGELVPQDPKDEPAAKLLDRIRAARTTAAPKSRPRTVDGRTRKTLKSEVAMLKRNEIKPNHLTDILKERGPLAPEALWRESLLEIDEFYDQLKDEEAKGLLRELREGSQSSSRKLEATP